ncbi:hypothetical protein BDV59DRAFT_200907 [Aspergillus ambiguus]|uniref:uncharacterized protein n=1 Tax=Aspergillus ambiguus TaxID=176160 RepID=UPI003CCD0D06
MFPLILTPEPSKAESPDSSPQMVSFEDLAVRYRQHLHKQARRKRLEKRLHATKVSLGISARLVRVGGAVQRGLVERLKYDDKVNFIALYHTLLDLQESGDPPSPSSSSSASSSVDHSPADRSPDFFLQLSPQSRADLIQILHLVRSDPHFLYERLCSLSPFQLNSLVAASAPSWEAAEFTFPSGPRSRTHGSSKRSPSHAPPFKDHILAFERTDPLSALLFNVYASPLDSDSPESHLRLEVWSSVCAKLIADGASRFDPLITHVLAAWAAGSDWKARPKFELYLMDILQTGAFLLEHVDTPPGLGFDADLPDPLRTDAAEEFFASAVDALFELLDDPDGGFPHAVLNLSSAILAKLPRQDCRNRFLEILYVQWFFSKFFYGALTYPEAHGLLLDFHIRKDAREKLLGQVGIRAYNQVFAVLHSMDHFSMVRPTVRQRIESMLHQLRETASSIQTTKPQAIAAGRESPAAFLMLSSADILTLLNALFPRRIAPPCHPPTSPAARLNLLQPLTEIQTTHPVYPGIFPSLAGPSPTSSSPSKSLFPTGMDFLSLPENSLVRSADRVRFELTDEPDIRHHLESPSAEEWTIFSVSRTTNSVSWGLFSDSQCSVDNHSVHESQCTSLGMEDNFEALQTAIVKLIQENPAGDHVETRSPLHLLQTDSLSLKERFTRAMNHCHNNSDFIGAHYWWNAHRQLLHSIASSPPRRANDSWILEPMHSASTRSLEASRTVIERCESDFVVLDRHMHRLQRTVKDMMATVARLRDKMWYMTDVKNSMRYEDAKNVALALKTMRYSARLYRQMSNEGRPRSGTTRSFGGSILHKPELQVMNVMRAPSSQGGPNKLSDEQVDLIRKWLTHHNIDNFCKGEERIHRFCYEVQASINRLVGETMAETPVLWASELFHKERAKYEGSSTRGFLGLSGLRALNPASDNASHISQSPSGLSPSDATPKSLFSDRWRVPREPSIADTSSIGGSPGKAASTSTGDTYSTFWSAAQHAAHYAPSVSSIYSRPPSLLNDATGPQHSTHGKSAFLDELRQTLTSLLLSDLGSPVWSCGSETDAWFGNALDQKRIQTQMKKRAQVQKFYAEYNDRLVRQTIQRTPSSRRSKSLDRSHLEDRTERRSQSSAPNTIVDYDGQPPFSYRMVFRQLIEVFSRHGNPFVKLKALRDLRSLVVASLSTNDGHVFTSANEPILSRGQPSEVPSKRSARHSFSEPRGLDHLGKDGHTPTSPAAESAIFESRPSDYSVPTEKQIVDALRNLLLEVKPKTLFRDLQFISAFVPGSTLNNSDSGTAFLQFGLAALSLKDEICNSMVEIADNIVSQELSRRHPPLGYDMTPRPGHGIEDAAGMWIITAKEGNPVAQRELAILYLTHPELLPRVTLPLTLLRDTFKAEMMYRRDKDSKSDPQSMCLALHWMQLSAKGGDELARNRLRERDEFESIS